MASDNQSVLDMIGQLKARLSDLEQDVLAFEGDLSYLAVKLDRIDDRVYLLEREVEELAARRSAQDGSGQASGGEEGATDGIAQAGAQASEEPASGESASAPASAARKEESAGILTPEAKEKVGEMVGDMREIGREAAETFSSLNEAFGDIAAPFKSFMKPGRR